VLFCFLTFVVEAKVNYRGQSVLSVTVPGHKLPLLKGILQNHSERDVWSNDGNLAPGVNHIRVKNTTISFIKAHFEIEPFIADIQDLIDQIDRETEKSLANKPQAFFDNYRRYAEIVAELQRLANAYPKIAQYKPSVATSVGGRAIPAIVISGAGGFKNDSINRIFFQGGQHAREWIGPATVMYLITQLLQNYGSDTVTTELLDHVQFVIVPLSNPDGYEYAHTNDRLWRKNRRRNPDGIYGVDLNRNWNDHWGGAGSSGNTRDETYRGPSAFSEPESLQISQLIEANNQNGNILAAIDFHSYSQLVLRPYGWTKSPSPDERALKILGDGIAYEIQRQSGKIYSSIKSIDLYITTGTASDWYYLEGIWGAYTIELRDTGTYGFLLPPSQIIPTGNEIWASMLYFCKTVLDTHP